MKAAIAGNIEKVERLTLEYEFLNLYSENRGESGRIITAVEA